MSTAYYLMTYFIDPQEEIVTKKQEEVGEGGWDDKTQDFQRGNSCLFPISKQHSILISVYVLVKIQTMIFLQ